MIYLNHIFKKSSITFSTHHKHTSTFPFSSSSMIAAWPLCQVIALRTSNSEDRSFSLEPIEAVFLRDFRLPSFGILLHSLHPLIPPLLQFIDWIEYLLLMPLIKRLLILLHLLEHLISILRLFLLQLFESLLEFAVLAHCDVVVHIEVTLICVVMRHERTQGTSWFVVYPLEILNDALVFLLYFSLDFLD